MLRAYDKKTGAELGAVAMPGAQTGSPMTYMLGGKQYIVVAVEQLDQTRRAHRLSAAMNEVQRFHTKVPTKVQHEGSRRWFVALIVMMSYAAGFWPPAWPVA